MPLDAVTSSKNVTATLHYLVRGTERPVRYVDEPPTGAAAYDGRARLSFHTSFENPLAHGAPPRESIEVRTLVFF